MQKIIVDIFIFTNIPKIIQNMHVFYKTIRYIKRKNLINKKSNNIYFIIIYIPNENY